METQIKNFGAKCNKFFTKNAGTMTTALMTAVTMLNTVAVHAEGAEELLQWIIGAIAMLITALGVVMAVTGVVAYASAHSEGDGPAMNKAKMQLASSVMIIVLSIALNASKDTLAGFLTTEIG